MVVAVVLTYITDMDKAPAVREVRARYFGETTPVCALVQVVRLARPELLLEIEVIAVVPAHSAEPSVL